MAKRCSNCGRPMGDNEVGYRPFQVVKYLTKNFCCESCWEEYDLKHGGSGKVGCRDRLKGCGCQILFLIIIIIIFMVIAKSGDSKNQSQENGTTTQELQK